MVCPSETESIGSTSRNFLHDTSNRVDNAGIIYLNEVMLNNFLRSLQRNIYTELNSAWLWWCTQIEALHF